MRPTRPHVAQMDEVRITRQDDTAIIRFLDPAVATTHLRVGPEIRHMSDEEILERFNAVIVARELLAASYHHVAVEVPPDRPQLMYFAAGDQWVPRGDVLRCIVHDGGPGNQAVIEIDDREYSLEEFGRMLTTYAGWGMRLCFVPDDEIDREPEIEVREPDEESEL